MAREAYRINEHGQVLMSLAQLGREIGITSTQVKRRLQAANVLPDAKGFYKITSIMPVFAGGGSKFSSEQERLAAVRADREHLKLNQERAELIQAGDMRRAIYLAMGPIVEMLDMLPQVLERDCGISGSAAEKAERILAGAREKCVADMTAAANGEIERRKDGDAAQS